MLYQNSGTHVPLQKDNVWVLKMASPMAAPAGRSPQPSEEEAKAVEREIPIRLTLGAATLSLGAAGQWELGTLWSKLMKTREIIKTDK